MVVSAILIHYPVLSSTQHNQYIIEYLLSTPRWENIPSETHLGTQSKCGTGPWKALWVKSVS